MGRKRDELLPLLRSFAVDDYLIFYRAMSTMVTELVEVRATPTLFFRLNDIPK